MDKPLTRVEVSCSYRHEALCSCQMGATYPILDCLGYVPFTYHPVISHRKKDLDVMDDASMKCERT